ncbi:MAG: TonB family protein [Novosphingobium sp.]
MSLLVLATAAAALASVSTPDYSKLIMFSDYPKWALAQRESTAAVVEFYVDPKGKIYTCKLINSTGSPKLAGDVCRVITRKKVNPARLADGTAVHAFEHNIFRLWTPGGANADEVKRIMAAPDLELTVKRTPAISQKVEGSLALAVAEDGTVIDCATSPRVKPENVAPLRQICTQRKLLAQPARLDEKGKPMTYVTEIRIALVPEG